MHRQRDLQMSENCYMLMSAEVVQICEEMCKVRKQQMSNKRDNCV